MVKFVQRDNVETANLIRHYASSDYQRRIPDVDKASVQQTLHDIWNYRPTKNEFVDTLINRIGREHVVFNSWRNKLAVFKSPTMYFGDTLEETGVGLVKANTYDPSRDELEKTLFGQHRPDTRTAFHKVNRMDRYDITVNEAMLRRAFIDATGLSDFVAAVMESPNTSNEWDEYLLMAGLFRQVYDVGGFWKVNVPDVQANDSDSPEARALLRVMRAWTEELGFISPHYNLARLDTFVEKSKVVAFMTPQTKAAIDVNALAAAFNMSYAEFENRIITVREQDVNIPGFQAIITDEDFFKVVPTLMEVDSMRNPATMAINYFLHSHGIVSASPMRPAILFTSTEPSDSITVNPTPVVSTSVVITDLDGNTVTEVERGLFYRAVPTVTTDPAGGYNDAARLEIEPGTSSTFTYIRQTGEFSIGLDEDATSITVNAFATDTPIPQTTGSVTVTVVGAKAVFPPLGVEEDDDSDGLFEATPEPIVLVDGKVTIPSVTGVAYRKAGAPVNNGSVHEVTEPTVFTAVARSGYELTAGTWSWTVG